MNLILSILLIAVVFVCAVASVMLCKHCTTRQATRTILTFLCDIFREALGITPPAPACYPVAIGHNGVHFDDAIIRQAFSGIASNFAVFYLEQVQVKNNVVAYQFALQRKPDSLPDEDLQVLIQKQAEAVLTRQLRECGVDVLAEPLTCVDLRSNDLIIAFAMTQNEIGHLDNIKRKIRKRYLLQAQSNNSTIKEEWNG